MIVVATVNANQMHSPKAGLMTLGDNNIKRDSELEVVDSSLQRHCHRESPARSSWISQLEQTCKQISMMEDTIVRETEKVLSLSIPLRS